MEFAATSSNPNSPTTIERYLTRTRPAFQFEGDIGRRSVAHDQQRQCGAIAVLCRMDARDRVFWRVHRSSTDAENDVTTLEPALICGASRRNVRNEDAAPLNTHFLTALRRKRRKRKPDTTAMFLRATVRSHALLAALGTDGYIKRLLLTVALHQYRHRFSCRQIGDCEGKIACVFHGRAIEASDHIALFDSGMRCRRIFVHDIDEHAFFVGEPDRLRKWGRNFLHLHAEPATRHFAVLAQLIDHIAYRIGRNRKADPHAAARG